MSSSASQHHSPEWPTPSRAARAAEETVRLNNEGLNTRTSGGNTRVVEQISWVGELPSSRRSRLHMARDDEQGGGERGGERLPCLFRGDPRQGVQPCRRVLIVEPEQQTRGRFAEFGGRRPRVERDLAEPGQLLREFLLGDSGPRHPQGLLPQQLGHALFLALPGVQTQGVLALSRREYRLRPAAVRPWAARQRKAPPCRRGTRQHQVGVVRLEVAGRDIADGVGGDAVGPWPVPGSQSGADTAMSDVSHWPPVDVRSVRPALPVVLPAPAGRLSPLRHVPPVPQESRSCPNRSR